MPSCENNLTVKQAAASLATRAVAQRALQGYKTAAGWQDQVGGLLGQARNWVSQQASSPQAQNLLQHAKAVAGNGGAEASNLLGQAKNWIGQHAAPAAHGLMDLARSAGGIAANPELQNGLLGAGAGALGGAALGEFNPDENGEKHPLYGALMGALGGGAAGAGLTAAIHGHQRAATPGTTLLDTDAGRVKVPSQALSNLAADANPAELVAAALKSRAGITIPRDGQSEPSVIHNPRTGGVIMTHPLPPAAPGGSSTDYNEWRDSHGIPFARNWASQAGHLMTHPTDLAARIGHRAGQLFGVNDWGSLATDDNDAPYVPPAADAAQQDFQSQVTPAE